MNNRFLLVIAAIVVLFVGAVVITRDRGKSPAGSGGGEITSHIYGEGSSGVTLLEYGDFQCSACAQFEPLLQQVRQKYQKEIFFQFRHFPLTQIHQNAMSSSRAAEAAGLQGKFWEMHDLLYQNQQSWAEVSGATQIFNNYASQLGLDIQKFEQDFSSTQVAEAINADTQAGQAANVNATPTFFIDNKKLEKNPTSLDEFSKLIDEAISAKQSQNQ